MPDGAPHLRQPGRHDQGADETEQHHGDKKDQHHPPAALADSPEKDCQDEHDCKLRLDGQPGQRHPRPRVLALFEQPPEQDDEEKDDQRRLSQDHASDREQEERRDHHRDPRRHAGHAPSQEITGEQRAFEVDKKPDRLGRGIAQRNEQDPEQPEPGRVIIRKIVKESEPSGCLVPAVVLLDLSLEGRVIRILAGGKDLAGCPVTDDVGEQLVPGQKGPAGQG